MTQKWINVKDRLPESNKPVLCYQEIENHPQYSCLVLSYDEGAFREVAYVYAVYEEERDEHGGEYPFITHWMPIPEPPKTK